MLLITSCSKESSNKNQNPFNSDYNIFLGDSVFKVKQFDVYWENVDTFILDNRNFLEYDNGNRLIKTRSINYLPSGNIDDSIIHTFKYVGNLIIDNEYYENILIGRIVHVVDQDYFSLRDTIYGQGNIPGTIELQEIIVYTYNEIHNIVSEEFKIAKRTETNIWISGNLTEKLYYSGSSDKFKFTTSVNKNYKGDFFNFGRYNLNNKLEDSLANSNVVHYDYTIEPDGFLKAEIKTTFLPNMIKSNCKKTIYYK